MLTDGSVMSWYLTPADDPTCTITFWIAGWRSITCASSVVSGALCRHGQLSAEPLHELMATGHRVTKNVVGPAAARPSVTPSLMPCTAADIAVTTNTPTAMPSMVSAARTLFERMASNAMRTPSKSVLSRSSTLMLFGTERDDGVEPRGPAGRVDPGENPDAGAEHDGDGDRPCRDARWQRRQALDERREAEAQSDADHGA